MQIVQMLQHSLSSCFKNPVGVAERSLEVLVSVSYVALSEQRYPLSELLYIYKELTFLLVEVTNGGAVTLAKLCVWLLCFLITA